MELDDDANDVRVKGRDQGHSDTHRPQALGSGLAQQPESAGAVAVQYEAVKTYVARCFEVCGVIVAAPWHCKHQINSTGINSTGTHMLGLLAKEV